MWTRSAFGMTGEVSHDLLDVDWQATPLGPPESWPGSLTAVVRLLLSSRFSMWMAWGPELTFFCNDAYRRDTLGKKYPWALGRPAREVWAEIWPEIGPRIASVMSTGTATWDESLLLFLERSGYVEETYHTFSYSPLSGDDGQVAGMLCVVSEDTERVIGERRMATLSDLGTVPTTVEDELEFLAAAAKQLERNPGCLPFTATYIYDEDGCARLACTSGVPEGHPVAPPLIDPAAAAPAWPLPRPGEAAPVVVERVGERFAPLAPRGTAQAGPDSALVVPLPGSGQDGAYGFLVAGASPHRPVDEDFRSFARLVAQRLAAGVASARSHVAERRRAAELARLDRLKTAFFSNVSHEFRTPLTLMLGPLEDALERVRDRPGVADRLEMVQRNGQRLLRLVNALLDFSRIEGGGVQPHREPADIGALTAQIAASFADLCSRAGIELTVRCEPVAARVDTTMWETIVLNLVSNAFKYTLEGSITVEVRPLGEQELLVRVTDTGSGIREQDLARIFDRFYRVTGAHGRSIEGSGIGLALVQRLVRLHDGTIGIESEYGRGTTVEIRMPRLAAGAQAADGHGFPGGAPQRILAADAYVVEAGLWLEREALPAAERRREGCPLVLVADDNADMRRHIARILGGRWQVTLARDGEEAMRLVRELRPDLLVTDVMMPGRDGMSLVGAIREDPDLALLPVIMISARAGTDSAGEGFDAGADDYLVKPFRSRELLDRVAARLDVAERERTSRERVEAAHRRTTVLAELASSLSNAVAGEQVLEAALAAAQATLGSTAAGLALRDDEADLIRIRYVGRLEAEFADRFHVIDPDARLPVAEAMRTARRVIVADRHVAVDAHSDGEPLAFPSVRSLLCQPLLDGERAFGALVLLSDQPHRPAKEQIELLDAIGDVTGRAMLRIEAARQEHSVAVELQRHLLELGELSRAAVVSARYEPAIEALQVGGDWYTALSLPQPGAIGISVGDIVGSGLHAAAGMSGLRSALGAAALATREPWHVLEILDRYAENVGGAVCATVAYAVIDTEAGSIDYACAGHPYPLLVHLDGTTEYLRDGRRPPLGLGDAAHVVDGRRELPEGGMLVLYTDGLVERRGESIDAGLERLAEAAARCGTMPAGAACDVLLAAMQPEKGYSDDVALIAVRPAGETATSLVVSVSPSPSDIPRARNALRRWLERLRIPDETAFDVLVAVGEAVNNAVQHGSGAGTHHNVSLEAFAGEGSLTVSVADCGHWASDSSASRRRREGGHGLTLIYGLSDSVEIDRGLGGTRVTMTFSAEPAGVGGGSPSPLPDQVVRD